jgi:dTDP-4-dehydrorhamnose reductase
MRILLMGGGGQLGQELVPRLRKLGEVCVPSRAECDLESSDDIRRVVSALKPPVIVNAAAYTAVDEAESHQELAYAVNSTAPRILAEEARKLDAMLVHYSTDYVFDGCKPRAYAEDDTTAPLNVYGASKLAGERAVSAAGGRNLILRTSWIYGAKGKNFLLTIQRLAREREELRVVADQVGAPTSAIQIARATVELVHRYSMTELAAFPSGVYHMTAAGSVSWCGFARAIVAALGEVESFRLQCVVPIASSEYTTTARRPLNSQLNNGKFERIFGFRLESWELGLAEVIREIRLLTRS